MGYLALITTWVGTWFGFKYSGLDVISHISFVGSPVSGDNCLRIWYPSLKLSRTLCAWPWLLCEDAVDLSVALKLFPSNKHVVVRGGVMMHFYHLSGNNLVLYMNNEQDGWMDERCFRPLLCTVKAELGRGQPGLMRWIWDETLPQSSIDRSTFYSAAHCATEWASRRPRIISRITLSPYLCALLLNTALVRLLKSFFSFN